MQKKRRKSNLRPLLKKLFMGAIMWFAKKVLEPIPMLGAVAEIVAFAV
ncbi:MAG TPA: hypothetical protein V6C76_10250 [Drouetiella sp.]